MKSRFVENLLLAVAPPLAALTIRFLLLTMRIEVLNRENLQNCEGSVIFSFWHDQLLLMVKAPRGAAKALISASKDGELIARTIAYFGLGVIRGSSTRGGGRAFRELVREARQNVDLGITPDGPKGPRHQIKEGVLMLARMTKRPIIPLAFACSRGHRFGSWDRFLLPFPFSRGVLVYGPAVTHDPEESLEQFGRRLQHALEAINAAARHRLEEQGVSAV